MSQVEVAYCLNHVVYHSLLFQSSFFAHCSIIVLCRFAFILEVQHMFFFTCLMSCRSIAFSKFHPSLNPRDQSIPTQPRRFSFVNRPMLKSGETPVETPQIYMLVVCRIYKKIHVIKRCRGLRRHRPIGYLAFT